jgi:hypothetical protein
MTTLPLFNDIVLKAICILEMGGVSFRKFRFFSAFICCLSTFIAMLTCSELLFQLFLALSVTGIFFS